MQESLQLRKKIDLAQYAGYPIHFFDYEFLLANVPAIATWPREKLENAIGARADNMISRADVRLPAAKGFHIIFSTHDPSHAQERANAICTDILKHFFGTDSLIPEGVRAFCRVSSLQEIAAELGVPAPLETVAPRGVPADDVAFASSPQEISPGPSLIAGMNALFRKHFGEERAEPQKFVFAPIWDSANERITSFRCRPANGVVMRNGPASDKSAADQCDIDIAALAFGLKGVWQIITRGDIALITVPVHIETLSWSKYRNIYMRELGHIEPRLLGLLAFRIYGLEVGSSLSQLSQGVSVLRRHARRIFVHLPTLNLDFSHAGFMGVMGLGTSAPGHGERTHEAPLDAMLTTAIQLKRICAGQNAIAFMDNVASVAALKLLKSQGVRMISGPIFDQPSEEPGPVGPLPLSEISDGERERARAALFSD